MLQRLKLPYTLQWVFRLFLLYLIVFTLFRLGAFIVFNPDKFAMHGETPAKYSLGYTLPAFLLGLVYDLRWISIILFPIVIASFVPRFTPFKSVGTKRFWSSYLVLATFVILFFFGADFGHFQYVRTRLNASALNFFEDAKIALRMLWESYPILWIFLGLAVVIIILTAFINRTYFNVENANQNKSKYDYKRRWYVITVLLFSFFIYGNLGILPLKTADSFRRMDDEFRGFLALNPFQNFFTSLKFRNPGFEGNKADPAKRASLYPEIAALLQLNPALAKDTNYLRIVTNNLTAGTKPNVVMVMCESLSTYKTSLGGNDLNPTPYLKQLADSSIYFDRCYSSSFGTARGLFGWLTGIPDVQLSKFSSRNESAVKHHTIINNFDGYKKYYFLGGGAEFNNFRGLIANIKDVKLYEEKNYASKPVNVWGIGDKNLLTEANNVLRNEQQPFFAVIQTADFHEPFTVPISDTVFKKDIKEKKLVKQHGFNSPEEYNALRYFDYNIQNFMEAAKKEKYFDNTIFVFFGDHGVIGNAGEKYPDVWTDQRLTEEHIPLIFYAPKLLSAEKHHEVVAQVDILPSIAGITKQSYQNYTIGRDIFDTAKGGNYAFTIFHDSRKIGLVSDSFYYIHNYNTDDDELYSLLDNKKIPEDQKRSAIQKHKRIAEGIYETSKWMLQNSK